MTESLLFLMLCKMIQILWIFRQPSILNLSSWLDKQQKSRITTQLCQFSTFPLRWFLCCANPKRHSWWLYNSNLSLNKMFFVRRRRRDWKSVEISFEVYRLEMIFEHCLPEEHRCDKGCPSFSSSNSALFTYQLCQSRRSKFLCSYSSNTTHLTNWQQKRTHRASTSIRRDKISRIQGTKNFKSEKDVSLYLNLSFKIWLIVNFSLTFLCCFWPLLWR